MRSIAIIGTGPAGMLAAWAAKVEGYHDITFFYPPDAPLRSAIHGAQYVHGLIHDLPVDPFEIRYHYFGDEEGYRQHIYGDTVPVGGSSWGRFRPKEIAWPMGEVYDYILNYMRGAATFHEMFVDEYRCEQLIQDYQWVFNTAPLNGIAAPGGHFQTETVFISRSNVYQVPRDEIWYFGDQRLAYRASNIRGITSTEYPSRVFEEIPRRIRKDLVRVNKPLSCEGVVLRGVYRLGRYGKWRKGELAHHVYEEVRRILSLRLDWTASLPPSDRAIVSSLATDELMKSSEARSSERMPTEHS